MMQIALDDETMEALVAIADDLQVEPADAVIRLCEMYRDVERALIRMRPLPSPEDYMI